MEIRIQCDDDATGVEFARRANAWAKRTGATVERQMTTGSDIAIIRPVELGRYAAANDARPVPEALRGPSHPMQWARCLTTSIDRLAGWGNEARAIPLAGEAYVLAYRADRFADAKAVQEFSTKYRRQLAPPTTWEDYAEVAEFFSDRGQPALPSLASDPNHLLREFHHVAACYDRLALTGVAFSTGVKDASKRDASLAEMLAFHYDIETGEPRLLKPAFVEAAKWLKRTARCRPPAALGEKADAASALATGSAVMAVLALRELGQLSRNGSAVAATVGIAPLPGTKVWYDPKTGQAKPPADKVKNRNFVPYFGTGGWVGVVRNGCPNPDAAFDLLADLSRLERSSELLSDPALGFGPFRVEHLDQSHEMLWQRYGFDAQQTHQLAEAIRHDVDVGLANPAVAPRGSDQAEQMKLLANELSRVVMGTASPDEAMKAADAAWRKADGSRPRDVLIVERRRSAGLQ